MVGYEIQVIGLDRLLVGLNGAGSRLIAETNAATEKATEVLEAEVKELTPRQTGHLFASIQGSVRDFGEFSEGRVGTALDYAMDVEFDTKPHVIEPRTARALMIPIAPSAGRGGAGSIFGGATKTGRPRSGQQVVFFRSVKHPGTKGQHMFRDGAERARPAIRDLFRAAVQRTLRAVKDGAA